MSFRWIHSDQNLTAHVVSGLDRALRGDWQSGPLASRATELQALTIATVEQMARLVGRVTYSTLPDGSQSVLLEVPDRSNASEPRRAAAGRLYATLRLLARPTRPATDLETAARITDTGALPALAVVAIVVAGGAAIAYCAHQAASVVDRELARKETTRRMVEKQAAALNVIAAHTARETDTGRTLPLDAASRTVLDHLHAQQKELLEADPEPFADFLPQQVQAGAGVASWLTPLALTVGVVGGAYLYLK